MNTPMLIIPLSLLGSYFLGAMLMAKTYDKVQEHVQPMHCYNIGCLVIGIEGMFLTYYCSKLGISLF